MRWIFGIVILLFMAVTAQAQTTTGDPCTIGRGTDIAFSNTASAVIIPGAPNQRVHICFLFIGTSGAQNISIVEGTGTACATGQKIMIGGPGATGPASQANGTWIMGNGGGTITQSTVGGNDVCLLQSAAGQVAGSAMYVATP
jgi:hypothetical protein